VFEYKGIMFRQWGQKNGIVLAEHNLFKNKDLAIMFRQWFF